MCERERESARVLYVCIMYLVGAELHYDVDVFLVFKDVLKLHNVLVPQRFVDLDLRLKLLPKNK